MGTVTRSLACLLTYDMQLVIYSPRISTYLIECSPDQRPVYLKRPRPLLLIFACIAFHD